MRKFLFTLLAVALCSSVILLSPRSRIVEKPPVSAPAAGEKSAVAATQIPVSATNSPAASFIRLATQKRAWDYNFFSTLKNSTDGTAIQFELTNGKFAGGIIRHTESTNGELIYVAGTLSEPEPGRFFFQKQTLPGKQGDFAGVVEFPGSKTAWRIEPTGPGGKSELVQRALGEVICLDLPVPNPALMDTNAPEEIPPLRPDQVQDYYPLYNDGIISLQSLPGATSVLYIDYRGGYTATWGGITYTKPTISNAQIKDVWKRVSEDYMPFTINVTTDIKVYQAAAENSRQRCVVTPTTTAAPGAGGVSYVGSWNSTGDTPNWVFIITGKASAEAISHEVGHSLGLVHDGQDIVSGGTTNHVEYYGGQGSGITGWAPIMGVGYYQPVSQWSKGEYQWANNFEDDINKIANNNNGVDFRTDDTGATLATSRYLEIYSNFTAFAEGVIETTGDTDAFRFTTAGGVISLTAYPVATNDWANLAISATLADITDAVIASNNVQTILTASIATNLPAGTYTFRVTGVGRNDPITNGFSNYASLGYYSITGTVANATVPSRFVIGENSTNGFVVGTVSATNLGVDALNYFIVSGNSSNAFALDNNGVLTVSNSSALNYETLALKTQFAVQFEMFVNITNTSNPALTELNRRVVVQVTNVNEAPIIVGFTNSLIAHTQPGTVAGMVQTSDPDFYSVLTLAIVSGNSNSMFAVDSASGNVTVSGDLDPTAQSVYNLAIKVTDNGTPALSTTNFVQINVITNSSPFTPGTISYAIYDGIGSGTLVINMTTNSRFPTDPTSERQITTAEGDSNRGDSYGSVLRGFVIPPLSGNYNFYTASDDSSELWMSTTTNPASMTLIASVTGATTSRQWNKYSTQKSAARALTAGQAYYIEERQKEGTGNDYMAVGWSGPATSNQTNVIPGTYLAPYFVNYIPHLVGVTNVVRRDAFAGFPIDQMTVTDVNSNDLHSFSIISGNASGIFGVDSNGWVFVANDAALAASATTNFTLSVRTTDNGTPSLSATNPAKITVIPASVINLTQIQREMFNNIGSAATVASLTGNSRFPGQPDALVALTNFASPVNVGDNYGSRIRALLVPSVTGDYQFFIASDDNSLLLFSRDTNAANATAIASVSTGNGWVNQNSWSTYTTQTSALITNLIAGQKYYIEAQHKEGSGGDHVEVAWLVPGSGVTNVIPGANLQALDLNYPPTFAAQSFLILQSVTNSATVGVVSAQDSSLDLLTFKIIGGNTNGTFAIDAGSGTLSVATNSLIAGGVQNFSLSVAVQDSGYGSLYPLHSATNFVFINVIPTNGLLWDVGGLAGVQDGNGNWAAAPTNWWNGIVNSIWTNNSVAFFGNGTATNCTVTITNDVTPAGIVFNLNSGGIYTLTNNGGAVNLATPTVITANTDAVISASIKGGSLVKNGAGKLTLNSANTFTGGLTNNAGTLALGIAGAQGSGAVTLNGGALYNTVAMTVGNQININSNVNLYAAISYNLNLTGALYGSGTLADNLPNQNASLTISGDLSHFTGTLLYADPDNTYNNVNIGSGATGAAGMNASGAKFVLSGGSNLARALRVLGNSGATFRLGDLSGTGGTLGLSGTVLSVGALNLDATFGGTINGNGSLTKSGTGTLTLTGTNMFTGSITVSGGKLAVNGVLTTNQASTTTVAAGGTLGGGGLVLGPVTVQSGGVLAPGSGVIGLLTVSNNITFSGGATATMEIAKNSGVTTNDVLFASGTLTQGGTLVVTNTGTDTLAAGDAFKLFNAGNFAGAFTNFTLPTLATNLAWATNTLATNGTLAIVVSLPFRITNSVFAAVGKTFTLNGTGTAGKNYVLLSATNLTAPVWLPVLTNTADANGLFQFSDSQTTNFPQRFYRVQGN
jgi:autotransporter-associated beta strand protein